VELAEISMQGFSKEKTRTLLKNAQNKWILQIMFAPALPRPQNQNRCNDRRNKGSC